MQSTPISVPGDGRTLDAYLSLPQTGGMRRPAVIVIHEIFGTDPFVQDVTRRFAREGYVAIAPNLFTGEIQRLLTPEAITAGMGFLRGLPPEVQREPARIRSQIVARPPEERATLAALMKIQDPTQHAQFARDLFGVAGYLRGRSDVEPRSVASVGFCFGGMMSGRLACVDPDLAAAVIFYGNTPPSEQIPLIRCPILGLYGAEDHRITDTVPQFAADAKKAGVRLSYHIYHGAGHAFFNDTRPSAYRADAALDAWKRVHAFLLQELRS